MRLIDQRLFLEFDELTSCGISSNTLKKANERNSNSWEVIKDPNDKRKVLFGFEKLKDCYKELVKATYGDPYEYMIAEPIKALIAYDSKAEQFYLDAGMPLEQCRKAAKAASVLNTIIKLYADKKAIKKLCGSLDAFFTAIAKIIEVDKIDLPTSYKRLISGEDSKLNAYKKEGYSALIHGNTGKRNAAKVEDDTCLNTLKDLLCHPNQFDDVLVCAMYNEWASKHGYKALQPRTVTHYRNEYEHEIIAFREGWDKYNAKYIRQVKGLQSATIAPLKMVECDDYNLNYYYRELGATDSSKNLRRYVSYIVADSSCGLILGASYRQAKAPTFEMVQIAWLDAMYYIRSLVGDGKWYMPFEVKADHWNKSTAFPYFKRIGHFIEPSLKNKQGRGYIEQLFGSTHLKRAEKLAAHSELNYNGNNITAINMGVNVEVLNQNASSRPFVGIEAEKQIRNFIHLCRSMPSITRNQLQAPSREQIWLERWHQLPETEKRSISDLQFLLTFGIKHEPQGRQITITNRGIEPTICGVKYSYDLPDYVAMQHLIDTKVNVIYDPYDMSRVLISDGDKVNFIATSATLQPRAIAYQYEGSRQALNMILAEKKAQVQAVSDAKSKRDIEGNYLDFEASMFGGLMPKEALALVAETSNTNDDWEAEQLAYLHNQTDFSQYTNS